MWRSVMLVLLALSREAGAHHLLHAVFVIHPQGPDDGKLGHHEEAKFLAIEYNPKNFREGLIKDLTTKCQPWLSPSNITVGDIGSKPKDGFVLCTEEESCSSATKGPGDGGYEDDEIKMGHGHYFWGNGIKDLTECVQKQAAADCKSGQPIDWKFLLAVGVVAISLIVAAVFISRYKQKCGRSGYREVDDSVATDRIYSANFPANSSHGGAL